MTIETYPPNPLQPASLVPWADEFVALATISAELARTHFVPQSLWVFRKRDGEDVFDGAATTAQVTAVIFTGKELGLGPMAALRSIDVIEGSPALRAVALRAVLLAHGHDIWVEQATNSAATVAGQRAGSEHVQRVTWTIQDARDRNLAHKRNWKQQPRNMLIARATGDLARLVAADALLGCPYTAEELQDGVVGSAGGVTPDDAERPAARRTRRPVAAAAPTGDAPGMTGPPPAAAPPTDQLEPDTPPPTEDEHPPSTDDVSPDDTPPPAPAAGALRRLHQLIRQRFGDYRTTAVREAVLTDISETIGRPVDSTSELNADEVQQLIRAYTPGPGIDDEPPTDEGAPE